MKEQSLYRELAKYYDAIYHWKSYEEEAAAIVKLVAQYKKTEGNTLLEVACGTGNHLKYLKKEFTCTGTDINEGMLRVARAKNKGVTFMKADMVTLNLGQQFDVVTCLFSSIGYLKTKRELNAAINNIAQHTKQGGVVLIEPWLTKEVYKPGSPHLNTYQSDDLKIARVTVSSKKGNLSVMDMHYLIAERNKKVKHFVDHHELAMFSTADILSMMKKAGLGAKYLKSGFMKDRGLLIGVKK